MFVLCVYIRCVCVYKVCVEDTAQGGRGVAALMWLHVVAGAPGLQGRGVRRQSAGGCVTMQRPFSNRVHAKCAGDTWRSNAVSPSPSSLTGSPGVFSLELTLPH